MTIEELYDRTHALISTDKVTYRYVTINRYGESEPYDFMLMAVVEKL